MRRKRKLENANASVLGENADPRVMRSPMGNTADARAMGNTGYPVMGEIANTRTPPLSPLTSEDLNSGETIEPEYRFSSTPSSLAPGTENTGLFDDALLGWSTVLNGGLDDTYGFDERHAGGHIRRPTGYAAGVVSAAAAFTNQSRLSQGDFTSFFLTYYE